MRYIKDGFEYSPSQIREDNPDISFPDALGDISHLGYFSVVEPQPPVFDPATERLEKGEIRRVNGNWLQTWRVVQLTPSERRQRLDEFERSIVAFVKAHLDAVARSYGYDDIGTAASYADEPAIAKFQEEGRAFRAWRSHAWARCFEVLNEVSNSTRSMLTEAELVEELPVFTLE